MYGSQSKDIKKDKKERNMKSPKTVAVFILLAFMAAGCSSVMPSPEVEITKTNPVALTGVSSITFTFANKNHVDAILTRNRIFCQGADTATLNYSINQYVAAGDTVDLKVEWDATGLNALRTAIGYNSIGDRTMTFYFSGTDAFGYEKAFTVREFTISF
jgi:hypothetical protein